MRLSFHCPNPSDGTAWYRCMGPLANLRRQAPEVFDVMPVSAVDVPTARFSDVAFFQRPATYKEVEMMKFFRRAGVPVIVDYDDNDLHVPSDYPSYMHFADPDVRNAMLYAMEIASAVMVSTPMIKEEVNRIYPNQKVYVVPNALDPHFHKTQCEPKTNTILWRGGNAHQRDLMSVAGALVDFCQNHPDVFTFYGTYPWFLEDLIPQKQFSVEKWQATVANYLARLSQISPRFGIVPLVDHKFNRSKSNISFLELTWAGAVCLVPHWAEFDLPGVVTYAGGDFLPALERMVHFSEDECKARREVAWEWIRSNRMLSQVNVLRSQIFMAAAERAPWPKADEEIPEPPCLGIVDVAKEHFEEKKDSRAIPHESGIAT